MEKKEIVGVWIWEMGKNILVSFGGKILTCLSNTLVFNVDGTFVRRINYLEGTNSNKIEGHYEIIGDNKIKVIPNPAVPEAGVLSGNKDGIESYYEGNACEYQLVGDKLILFKESDKMVHDDAVHIRQKEVSYAHVGGGW